MMSDFFESFTQSFYQTFQNLIGSLPIVFVMLLQLMFTMLLLFVAGIIAWRIAALVLALVRRSLGFFVIDRALRGAGYRSPYEGTAVPIIMRQPNVRRKALVMASAHQPALLIPSACSSPPSAPPATGLRTVVGRGDDDRPPIVADAIVHLQTVREKLKPVGTSSRQATRRAEIDSRITDLRWLSDEAASRFEDEVIEAELVEADELIQSLKDQYGVD